MRHLFSGKVLSSVLIMAELGILSSTAAFAAEFPVKVDQLGYLPFANKVAVLSYKSTNVAGPVVGSIYIRRKADGVIQDTFSLSEWSDGAGGNVHSQSGDVGASADFTTFTTPGVYYFSDASNNRLSADFVIGAGAYAKALKHAMKTYYYQRVGTTKPASFAGAAFEDTSASYMRYNQDPYATSGASFETMQSGKTKKDLRGGWMDAGDPNKYVMYAALAVVNLLDAYTKAPWAYDDNVGIPETGNGVPDLIDEVMWEIEFLKRMQNATGTGGFLAKVGLFRNNKDASSHAAKKVSEDDNPRYYVGECPYSTISGAAALAAAANVFGKTSAGFVYGKDLADRAALAWARNASLIQDTAVYDNRCDPANVVLAANDDPETKEERKILNEQFAMVSAVYLYEYFHLRNTAVAKTYKAYIEAAVPIDGETSSVKVPRYMLELSKDRDLIRSSLLNYSKLSTVSAPVREAIQEKIRDNVLAAYPLDADGGLYAAALSDGDYTWGSAAGKHAAAGSALLDYASLDDAILGNVTLRAKARAKAASHGHWLNGFNPLSLMMLTNMPAVDPSNTDPFNESTRFNKSVPNMYHMWFGGTGDTCYAPAASASLCQPPPPAYLMPGPCNPGFGEQGTCFDGGAFQRNFDATQSTRSFLSVEPSIWVQSRYPNLLARLSAGGEAVLPTVPTKLTSVITAYGVSLGWTNASDSSGVAPNYNVYMKSKATSIGSAELGDDLLVARNVRTSRAGGLSTGALLATTSASIKGLNCGTLYAVVIQSVDASGNKSSTTLNGYGKTLACLSGAPKAATTLAVTPVAATADTDATLTWKGLPATNLSHFEVRVNGQSVGRVEPVTAGAYSFDVTGLKCGSTNTFTVRAVHPDAVKFTDANFTPSAAAGACVASTIFKHGQMDYFWDDGAGWDVSGRAITNGGATLETVVAQGGGIGIRRHRDFSSELPVVSGAATTGPVTNASTAKLVFDITVVRSNTAVTTPIKLVPVFYYVNSATQVDSAAYVHFDTAVLLNPGVATPAVAIALKPGAELSAASIGASLLRKIAFHLPDETATVRLSNVRIVH